AVVVGAVAHPAVAHGHTPVQEHVAVAALTIDGGGEAEGVAGVLADEGDPPVAQLHEVLGGHPPTHPVVGAHHRHVVAVRVDQHHRHPGPAQPVEVVAGGGERHDEQAVGPVGTGEGVEGL